MMQASITVATFIVRTILISKTCIVGAVLEASSYGAREVFGTLPAAAPISILRLSSKMVLKSDQTGLAAMLYQNSRVCAGKVPVEATAPIPPATWHYIALGT